jgi:outer membrane protein assembly factor BamB
MAFTRQTALLLAVLLLATCCRPAKSADDQELLTHPLVPGLRSSELNDADWARPFHDRVGSGFSPLLCNIDSTPSVWSSIQTPGQLRWLTLLTDAKQGTRLLVNDGRLRLVDVNGQVIWTSTKVAPVLYHGPLRGDDRNYLLLGGRAALTTTNGEQRGKTTGPQLVLMNADTGLVEWQYVFNNPRGHVKPAVGDVLPGKPGLEVAVFLSHAEDGCLINFPPSGDPEFIWQKKVVIPGEYDEQYDHGCDIKIDFSQPDEPVIWNVRRFRCRGFNARTGQMLSTLSYDIGGAHRRNYGPWNLGVGRDGQPVICVVSNRVQTHVHGIELTRSGENRLAWEHYYGEVHKESPGVVVEHLAIADLDNDGITEVAYTVRDPKQNLRSFVRVRDAQTGEIEVELPDCWGLATVQHVGSDKATCLLTISDPDGRMPGQGNINVYAFDDPNTVRLLGEIPDAKQWGPLTVTHGNHNELLVRQTDEQNKAALVCYDIHDGQLQKSRHTAAAGLTHSSLRAELPGPDGEPIFLNTNYEGQLQAWTWSGDLVWELPLAGRYTPSISAADWNGDGKAELFVSHPNNILNVHSINSDGDSVLEHAGEYLSSTSWTPTILRDKDGRQLLVSPAASAKGNLEIRLTSCDGSVASMELPIPATVPSAIVINVGDFLPGGRQGIAVSVSDNASAQQGVYLLEVDTGKLLWHRDRYKDGLVAMPYTMRGVPAAYDIDGDGAEEIVMDLLSYMAFVRGNDGSFAYILPSSNIRTRDSMFAGKLYNSFSPVFKSATDTQAHWLVTAGIGSLGLMKPDPREGYWKHELMYDMPRRLGMIDVDNDGVMEVGYALANRNRFLCRDLWTGEIEWEVTLPHPINSPVITADVDGDGKGEFLVDRFCIGTNDQGQGEIRFQLPQPLGYGLIADFDGDGVGEIGCSHPGGIAILKPPLETPAAE